MAQFTTVRQYFRRYSDTPWYIESPEYRTYVNETYHQTGKIISSDSELDEDQLILTKVVVWDSEESRNEFVNDPNIKSEFIPRKEYHDMHGIVFRMVIPPNPEV
jgi:hypothetical protein